MSSVVQLMKDLCPELSDVDASRVQALANIGISYVGNNSALKSDLALAQAYVALHLYAKGQTASGLTAESEKVGDTAVKYALRLPKAMGVDFHTTGWGQLYLSLTRSCFAGPVAIC